MALVRMHRDPALGEPHVADVHPNEVPKWEARGWVVGDAPPPEGKTITGLANTVWDPDNYREDRAATEGQLAAVSGGGGSNVAWKPAVSPEGDISWTRSSSTTAPTPQNIRGPQGDPGPQGPPGEKGDPGTGGDAKVLVAEYNVTTAQEIRDYLDSGKEPFAPILVKRGGDYYTAALATRSGDDKVIVRVMGSGSGDYIIFNYTITGAVWSSSSHIFQKKLESGVSIKTVNGQSLLGSGDIDISGGDLPQYELCDNDAGGNVIQKGEIVISGATFGIFEFYFKTESLPNTGSQAYSFATLLADYAIESFVDATGVTSDGIFVGNGRTDGENRLIVQQFSKNNKTVTIKTYKDFSDKTALLKIRFIGTKTT